MSDYNSFCANLLTSKTYQNNEKLFEKEAPIIYTLMLLINNKQLKQDKIFNVDRESRSKFNNFQKRQALRVIGMVQMLRGYDYPERVILLDRDPNIEKGKRTCFLFENKEKAKEKERMEKRIDEFFSGEVDIDGNVVINQEKAPDSQMVFSQIDSILETSGEVLAQTVENVSINETMQLLKVNLFEKYPKFVNLKMYFESSKKEIDPKKFCATWLNVEQIEEIADDIIKVKGMENVDNGIEWNGLSKGWNLGMVKDEGSQNDGRRQNGQTMFNDGYSDDDDVVNSQLSEKFESQSLLGRKNKPSVQNEKTESDGDKSDRDSSQQSRRKSTVELTSEELSSSESVKTVSQKSCNEIREDQNSDNPITVKKSYSKTVDKNNPIVFSYPLETQSSYEPSYKKVKLDAASQESEKNLEIVGLETKTYDEVEDCSKVFVGQETIQEDRTLDADEPKNINHLAYKEKNSDGKRNFIRPKRHFIKL